MLCPAADSKKTAFSWDSQYQIHQPQQTIMIQVLLHNQLIALPDDIYIIYYIDKSVLLENRQLVKFI